MKEYKLREVQRFLKQQGYELERSKGDHLTYVKSGQPLTFTIPLTNDLPRPLLKRLMKEHNLNF